ncbi:MAG: primosomal protein N' [Pseudomonadota bacterium]
MPESPPILRVAVAAPVRKGFDYLCPPETEPPTPGCRVLVPFGTGERVGVVLEHVPVNSRGRHPHPLKVIRRVLDDRPVLQARDLSLLRWAADYYQYAIGEVVAAALPVRLREARAMGAAAAAWQITPRGRSQDPEQLRRSPRQRALLETLAAGKPVVARELQRAEGDVRGALRRLQHLGLVERTELAQEPPVLRGNGAAGPPLNAEQSAAVADVTASFGRFQAFLLEGVTGSGKTEVYISLATQAIRSGRQVLLLVPEIGLTPQVIRRLRERVGGSFVLLHSGLSEGERAAAWRAAAEGVADMVVGTRSALLTPVPRLGLIILDEEHDLSFKQQEGFRYSARDLAVVRAHRTGCPAVLGSATPSLESLHNVARRRYRRLHLGHRAGGAAPPGLELVDTRSQRMNAGLSASLIKAVRGQLSEGNQVLLFLNRRGYAPVLSCYACGWLADCPHCDARLTLHAGAGSLRCHHCGYQRPLPSSCPECGAGDLRPLGRGTERVEEALASLFPGTPMVRIDRDTTRRKGSLELALEQARSGSARLLLGTQMLAKGHHFPAVTLVGVLDADAGLLSADYRAPERTAQLLIQVAGRAGRAERPGRVMIQTRYPDHPLLIRLVTRGYAGFAKAALEERRAAGLPPYSHQVLLRAEAADAGLPGDFLAEVAHRLRDPGNSVEIWGPAPALMEKRGGRYRAQLLLQSVDRRQLQDRVARMVRDLDARRGKRRVRWSLDVDPQELF